MVDSSTGCALRSQVTVLILMSAMGELLSKQGCSTYADYCDGWQLGQPFGFKLGLLWRCHAYCGQDVHRTQPLCHLDPQNQPWRESWWEAVCDRLVGP